MYVALIIIGGVLVLGAALVGLGRVRRRAVAPVAAAVIGLVLVVLGISAWPPVTTIGAPSPRKCVEFTPGAVPATGPVDRTAGLPVMDMEDLQELPMQMWPGWPAGGVLVRSSAYPVNNPGFDPGVVAAIAPAMRDLDTADFDDTSRTGDGGLPFLQLAVGTPRSDVCWTTLAATALRSYSGGADYNVQSLTPGPHMATFGAVFLCGYAGSIVDTCAWAGRGIDERPIFGILRLGVPLDHAVTGDDMVDFADQVFKAIAPF
jgi:hypothetical protein